MAASTGILRATRVAGAPRRRALVLTAALVGTLWGSGFATGRLTAPEAEVTVQRGSVESVSGFIRPGTHRGQVRFGPGSGEGVTGLIRPGRHGGGNVKGG